MENIISVIENMQPLLNRKNLELFGIIIVMFIFSFIINQSKEVGSN